MQAGSVRRQVAALVAAVAVAMALGVPVATQSQNVTGDWTFAVQTDQGSGSPSISFKQDGESLTGTYTGLFGTAPLKGTAIEFSFESEAQGQRVDSVYKGTVEKDEMKGTVAIAGGQLNGTFTASRKK